MFRALSLLCVVLGIVLAVVGIILLVMTFDGPTRGEPLITFAGIASLAVSALLIIMALVLVRKQGPGHTLLKWGGEVNGYVINQTQTRKWENRAYEVCLSPRAKNSPHVLSVKVPARVPLPIQFTGTTWFDTLCKNIGLAKEYQTGDKRFDEAIYIRCASDGFAKKVLADPQRRRAIETLQAMGFQVVQASGSHVEARWSGFDPSGQHDPQLTDRAAELLFTLAAGIPSQDPEFAASQIDIRLISLVLLWLLLLGFAALFPCVFVWPTVRLLPLLLLSGALTLLLWLTLGWVAAWLLRGTSVSHDRWLALMLGALVAVPLGSIGCLSMLNGYNDKQPRVIQTAPILSTRIDRNKRGNPSRYYASIRDWASPDEQLEFQISQEEHGRVLLRQTRLQVTVGVGALGLEWVEKRQVLPDGIAPRQNPK